MVITLLAIFNDYPVLASGVSMHKVPKISNFSLGGMPPDPRYPVPDQTNIPSYATGVRQFTTYDYAWYYQESNLWTNEITE